MKLNIEVDLDDLCSTWGDGIDEVLHEHIRNEVMKIVKKDPKYKAFINKKASDMLNNINL
jgi:hypothetical protein